LTADLGECYREAAVNDEKRRAPQDPQRLQVGRAIALASACGIDLAVLVVVGVFAGHLLDDHLHSSPWGLLVGLFVGLAAGCYTVYLLLRPILRSLL
jgi:ATP synthase protein I